MSAVVPILEPLDGATDAVTRLQVHMASNGRCLRRVRSAAHPEPVLETASIPGRADVLGVRLTSGESDSPLCTASARTPPETADVVLYTDTAERLDQELAARVEPVRAVRVNPDADSFPPHTEVQNVAAQAVDRLAARGVDAWLSTRGFMRPAAERVLIACREHVKLTVPFTTLDRNVQRVFEPLAASPNLRLRQAERLLRCGVSVQVSLDPLVPGLTDTRASLQPLLEALAAIGVRHVSAGYLVMRANSRDALVAALQPYGWHDVVLDAFADGCTMKIGRGAPAWSLAKPYRQRGYARLISLAAEVGIAIRINALTNPDFCAPAAGDQNAVPRQRLLPGIENFRWRQHWQETRRRA